jgi:hypothetical protein
MSRNSGGDEQLAVGMGVFATLVRSFPYYPNSMGKRIDKSSRSTFPAKPNTVPRVGACKVKERQPQALPCPCSIINTYIVSIMLHRN